MFINAERKNLAGYPLTLWKSTPLPGRYADAAVCG